MARLNSDQIRAKLDAARADLEQIRARQPRAGSADRARKRRHRKARAAEADVEAQIARNEALLADAERTFQRQSELRRARLRDRSGARHRPDARATRNRRALSSAQRAAQFRPRRSCSALPPTCTSRRCAARGRRPRRSRNAKPLVRQIEVDLRNTEIRSPVSGVVVQRNVELGQTVAASLQSPTLFLIADDLRRMEISANIDEADVGRIKPGQRATFTVNAFPGRTFEGTVKQVRLGFADRAECGDLHGHRFGRESAPRTAAGNDRHVCGSKPTGATMSCASPMRPCAGGRRRSCRDAPASAPEAAIRADRTRGGNGACGSRISSPRSRPNWI